MSELIFRNDRGGPELEEVLTGEVLVQGTPEYKRSLYRLAMSLLTADEVQGLEPETTYPQDVPRCSLGFAQPQWVGPRSFMQHPGSNPDIRHNRYAFAEETTNDVSGE